MSESMEPQIRHTMDPIVESSEIQFLTRHRRCFSFPCFGRTAESPSVLVAGDVAPWWKRMRDWASGVDALMKIREWSEILAGPQWKTFIRRLNRNRSGGRQVSCQYDPLSYALNFDRGCGDLEEESGDGNYYSRNFTSRYAMGALDLVKPSPSSS